MERCMNMVDEYVELKAQIQALENRLAVLREHFMSPGVRLRSAKYEVSVRQQTHQIFLKNLLPAEVLNSPYYWSESRSAVVTVKRLATPKNIALVERLGA